MIYKDKSDTGVDPEFDKGVQQSSRHMEQGSGGGSPMGAAPCFFIEHINEW